MQFLHNFWLKLFPALLLTSIVFGEALRFQTEDLVYYLEIPASQPSYPILIAIEGSYNSKSGPTSVLRLHSKLVSECMNAGIGLVTLERRGMDRDHVDLERFHRFNTPTQRLLDHCSLVEHLRTSPPTNWNGKLIILGGSEGAAIAIKLSHLISPLACIAIGGGGDEPFKEDVWNFIQSKRSNVPKIFLPLIDWWFEIPDDREHYDILCDAMKADPDPTKWWFGQTFLYWSDVLDQTVDQEFLNLQCPILVIAGGKDFVAPPPDRLVYQAQQNHQDVTYLRIEGMDHNALNPEWRVLGLTIEFLRTKIF